MTELYLIRHGEYVSIEGQWLADPGLSPEGKHQAVRLHDRLLNSSDIQADVLVASTLLRARETAEIIAPALGVPIIYNDALREWNNEDGPTTYKEYLERMKTTPHDQRPFLSPSPVCESWSGFMFRACNALNQVLSDHHGKRVVVVCHGGIIEAAFVLFAGMSINRFTPIIFDATYTSITHWQRIKGVLMPDRWMLERFNDAHHLQS